MNKKRRGKVCVAQGRLDDILRLIEEIKDEEEDCLSNIPDNLCSSDRYEEMESAVSTLEDVITSIETAISGLQEVCV